MHRHIDEDFVSLGRLGFRLWSRLFDSLRFGLGLRGWLGLYGWLAFDGNLNDFFNNRLGGRRRLFE